MANVNGGLVANKGAHTPATQITPQKKMEKQLERQ